MSLDQPSNPYLAPGKESVAAPVWPQAAGMEYMQSVTFVWSNPNWIVNVLLAAACMIVGGIIPILPGLVLIGYQCEMLEAMLVRPHETYPNFKVDRIMDYLVRGVWPFIIGLLGSLVVVPVILLVLIVPGIMLAVLINAVGNDEAGIVIAIMVPIIVILIIITVIVCHIALVPFLIRAALTQEIGASLDFQFAKDFIRRMWKETALAGLFLMAVVIAAEFVGLLLLCIGVLFTMPFIYFTQTHLAMQLYRLYLARGGEKIPLKTPAIAV